MIVGFFGQGNWVVVVIAIGITGWTLAARLVRGEFLMLREMDFVHAARALGAGHSRIVGRHMLPPAMSPLIVAAAIGVGLPVDQPSGNMIIDIGGGTSEIAVIALNGIVCDTSIRVGGDELDEAIVNYIKKNHNLLIGDQTAENIKKTIGSAHKFDEEREMEVKGLYQVSGVPKTLKISSMEIREALQEPIQAICDALKQSLEQTPPELAADIVDSGIVLTGGGALLKNLDKLLREESGLPITVTEDPLSTVALGSGKTLDSIDILKQVMIR